jgi:hypothetical protein
MMIRTTRSSISVKPLSSRVLMRCLRECMQVLLLMDGVPRPALYRQHTRRLIPPTE